MSSEPKFHHIKVKLNAYDTGEKITLGTVELDGIALKGVRTILVRGGYKQVTEVTLTFIASVEADIDRPEVLDGEDS